MERYYHLADNKRQNLSKIIYILQHSTAKLFAAKYKLKTVSKVFKIAGKNLGKEIKVNKYLSTNDNELKSRGKKETKALQFVKYCKIPRPDVKPLNKNFYQNKFNPLYKSTILPEPLVSLKWRSFKSSYTLNLSYMMCGSFDNVEMHPIKELKHIKGKDKVELYMMAAKKKQISSCHKQPHESARNKKVKENKEEQS